MKTRILLAMVLAVALLAGTASATTLTFETDGDLSGWYTDRYDPAVFEIAEFNGESRLHMRVNPSGPTSGFSSFQGKKYDTNLTGDIMTFSIDMYVDADWDTSDRSVGLWGVGHDEDGIISAYPILAFRGTASTARGFYSWDGAWSDDYMAVENYNEWYNLKFVLTKGVGFEYFINNSLMGTFSATNTSSLENVILNAYNFGEGYDIYWDNFVYDATVVPEPATMTLLGLGLGGLALSRIRRRKAA